MKVKESKCWLGMWISGGGVNVWVGLRRLGW